MPIFVSHCHLLYNLLNILVGGFHCAIHLRPVRRRIVMLDLELRAEFGDHLVVEIGTVICDNPFRSAIPTDKIMLHESSHNILGNRCERGCLYPLGEIVNCHKDETVSVGSRGLDFSNHVNAPHRKSPRSGKNIQRYWRYVHFVCIYLALVTRSSITVTISFHGGPIVTCPQNLLSHSMSTRMGTKRAFV